MVAKARLYAGEQLRALRGTHGINQAAMAARLGISVSYLSQLENGERPLTAAVTAALRRRELPAGISLGERLDSTP